MNETTIQSKLTKIESELKRVSEMSNTIFNQSNYVLAAQRSNQFGVDEAKNAVNLTVGGSGVEIIRNPSGAMELIGNFRWDQMPFGFSYKLTGGDSQPGKIRILTGDIRKATYTPVAVDEVDVTIGTSDTWVGLKCYRDMTNAEITTDTSKPVSDDTWYKCWFYIFKKIGNKAVLQRFNLGQIMDVDITGYGD